MSDFYATSIIDDTTSTRYALSMSTAAATAWVEGTVTRNTTYTSSAEALKFWYNDWLKLGIIYFTGLVCSEGTVSEPTLFTISKSSNLPYTRFVGQGLTNGTPRALRFSIEGTTIKLAWEYHASGDSLTGYLLFPIQ